MRVELKLAGFIKPHNGQFKPSAVTQLSTSSQETMVDVSVINNAIVYS